MKLTRRKIRRKSKSSVKRRNVRRRTKNRRKSFRKRTMGRRKRKNIGGSRSAKIEPMEESAVFELDNGDIFQYTGNFIDGKPNGRGRATFKKYGEYEGEYEGNWKDGKMHGRGIYTYKNGDVYDGDWENGKKHGKGRYTYNNGKIYAGDWDNDKKHGQIEYTDPTKRYPMYQVWSQGKLIQTNTIDGMPILQD